MGIKERQVRDRVHTAALHEHGVPFRESIVPRDGTIQLFVHDPDGLKLELNFSGTVAEASRV